MEYLFGLIDCKQIADLRAAVGWNRMEEERRAIARIREMDIPMISVIYGEESLRPFYEKFGFFTMLCGQMQTREE